MGRIIHGNENFGYAPITVSGNTPSFGAPVMMEGMVSCEAEVEQETTTIYADNKAYCKVKGAKVRTVTVNFRYIPASYLVFLGFKIASNGGVTDTGSFPNHCIFFETVEEDCETGEETKTLHYFYNVTGSEPSLSTTTDEDEVEALELEVEYNANDSTIAKDADDVYAQYFSITRTEENKATYDTFTTTVLMPV